VVGAIGVSGASSADEDQQLAVLGADAFVAAVSAVPRATRIDASEMEAAFSVGRLVVDTDGYQIDAARRTGPGTTEVHDRVTDVMYVLAGKAAVVTGDDASSTTSELAPGDLLVIPATVPHTFTAVSDPFRYLVVKVAG
jgi:glc operon protein GlcG